MYIVKTRSDGGKDVYSENIRAKDYSTPGQALDAACTIRDRKLQEMHQGEYIQHAPTVAEIYSKYHEVFSFSVKTKDKHDIEFRQCLAPFAHTPLDRIGKSDILKSLNALVDTQRQKAIDDCLSLWRGLYRTASYLDLPIPDKTVGLIAPRSKKPVLRSSRTVSDEEFKVFLEALASYHVYDEVGRYRSRAIWYACVLEWYCGLQPAEVYGLCRQYINIESKTLRIVQMAGSTSTERRQLIPPKNSFRIRTVHIPDEAISIVSEMLQWSPHYGESTPVLADYDGLPFETRFVSNYIHLVCKKCNIRYTAYMGRHTFSTDLHKEGKNTAAIRDEMGHRSESMTLAYADSDLEERAETVKNRSLNVTVPDWDNL